MSKDQVVNVRSTAIFHESVSVVLIDEHDVVRATVPVTYADTMRGHVNVPVIVDGIYAWVGIQRADGQVLFKTRIGERERQFLCRHSTVTLSWPPHVTWGDVMSRS